MSALDLHRYQCPIELGGDRYAIVRENDMHLDRHYHPTRDELILS